MATEEIDSPDEDIEPAKGKTKARKASEIKSAKTKQPAKADVKTSSKSSKPSEPPEPVVKEMDARVFNGGARTIPPKPPGVAKGIRARTFEGWVAGLTKREIQPHHFLLELPDGDPKMIPLMKSRAGHVLISELISTIETFEPVKVEAFSRDEESEDEEEMSLGQWVFPKKPEEEPSAEVPAPSSLVAPPPGYIVEEGDSDAVRQLKTFTHLLADAYRYNSEASGRVLDSMSRVMEMQANAFARERESIDKTVQQREKLAKMNAANRFRIGTPVAGASDVTVREEEEEEEEETEERSGNRLIEKMVETALTEYIRRGGGAGGGSPPPAAAAG